MTSQHTAEEKVAATAQIARAAAYYARATAIRAVHGVLPEPDPEADALFWKGTAPSIQAQILRMVKAIFAAANPQPEIETPSAGDEVTGGARRMSRWQTTGGFAALGDHVTYCQSYCGRADCYVDHDEFHCMYETTSRGKGSI